MKNNSSIRSALKHLLTIVLALAFLWFAFRNTNMDRLFFYARSIKVEFLPLVVLFGIISHLMRAKRWVYLLHPLKDQPIRLWNSFCAVLIGYAVNIVIPRGGEVARLVTISKEEDLPWAGVLPTMLIDRLFDIAVLSILFGFTLFQLPVSIAASFPWLKTSGLVLVVLAIAGLVILPFVGKILKTIVPNPIGDPASFTAKMHKLAEQFEIGTRSLRNPAVFPPIAICTAVMWLSYWGALELMLFAFRLEKIVSLPQSLQVFTLSSFSVLIPTPGSVGSYHLFMSKALVLLCGVNQDLALAFASVSHLFSFIITNCVTAAFCILVSGFSKPRVSN
jgi:glycosyltransferase 2 family protein